MKRHKATQDVSQAGEPSGASGPAKAAAESTPAARRVGLLLRAIPASLLRTRRARAAAGLGAAAVVFVTVAAVAFGPLTPRAPGTTPTDAAATASAGSSGSALPTETPTETLLPWPTPSETSPGEETPAPTPHASGWPIVIEEYMGWVWVAPDGTIFIDGYYPLLPTGARRASPLPAALEGSNWHLEAFAPDGTVYVSEWSSSADNLWNARLWALDAAGEPKAGWPVVVDPGTVLPGPSGTVYVLNTNGEDTDVLLLGRDGTVESKMTLAGGFCDYALRPDGTLFVATGEHDPETWEMVACKVRVFGPNGKETTKTSAHTWSHLTMAEDGTVVVWARDPEPAGHEIAQTRMAVLGADGLPLPGWPLAFEGTAYPPAFGPDGSLYVTVLGLGTAPSRVEALDRTGATRPGWPLFYPAGYGPREDAERPVIGPGGGIFLTAVNHDRQALILGYDAGGSTLPGWPYQAPKPFAQFSDLVDHVMVGRLPVPNPTPLFVPGPGAGLMYVALEDRVLALDAAGKAAPGWPFVPRADSVVWSALVAMPGGGLVVVYEATDDGVATPPQARCFTASGKAPK